MDVVRETRSNLGLGKHYIRPLGIRRETTAKRPEKEQFNPCQGRGREFESRFPLQTPRSNAGRFCLCACHPGLQGALPEPADYKHLTKHPSADRPQNPGVCGCPFYKMLIIRVLRQNTPQTFCIVLKWTRPAEWTGRRSGSKEKSSPCAL